MAVAVRVATGVDEGGASVLFASVLIRPVVQGACIDWLEAFPDDGARFGVSNSSSVDRCGVTAEVSSL